MFYEASCYLDLTSMMCIRSRLINWYYPQMMTREQFNQMEIPQELFDNFYLPIKMSHGKFRMRMVPHKSGFIKCPCGYVYKYETESYENET